LVELGPKHSPLVRLLGSERDPPAWPENGRRPVGNSEKDGDAGPEDGGR
jgi:hypothetical protein